MPANEQFDAIKSLIKDRVIRCAGLSEVNVAEIEAASKYLPGRDRAEPLQPRRPRERGGARALREARRSASSRGARSAPAISARDGSALDAIARKHKATPGQIALAWLLKRSPVMLPIPGTGKVAHLEENVGAAAIKLTDDEFATLDQAGRGRR